MPTTYAIPDGRVAMAATTYTGTGATQTISNAVNGVGFQPDFVWFKSRATTYYHSLFDSVRGVTKGLASNDTAFEFTSTAGNDLAAFTSTGFTVGAPEQWNSPNNSSSNPVAWQWKAGGAAVTNTAGSITSQVSANTTAGFSVVTYTGTGANATVGHGLGVAPNMVIVKVRGGSDNWTVYRSDFSSPANDYLQLNTTIAKATYSVGNGIWNGGANSSTFGVGPLSAINQSANTFVAYCFAAVPGYSAFGSYTGNGSSTDGPFVYLGFRPRFIMTKRYTATGNWVMLDTARNPYNDTNLTLYANASDAESTGAGGNWGFDILSNGFKIRGINSEINTSGQSYLYAAFGENPLKYSNAR